MAKYWLKSILIAALLTQNLIACCAHSHCDGDENATKPHVHLHSHAHPHSHSHPHHHHGDHPDGTDESPSGSDHSSELVVLSESLAILTIQFTPCSRSMELFSIESAPELNRILTRAAWYSDRLADCFESIYLQICALLL